MPVPNPAIPVKGAGTTLWVYNGSGDSYANPLSDVDWSRLAKVKDLTPGELTAESYDDSYLDDEDADWTATGQGQKSAGDTSFTLAWMPGEQGQQALLAWFNEGDTRAYKIRFPPQARCRHLSGLNAAPFYDACVGTGQSARYPALLRANPPG
ncbi:major tail protein V [Escherichia coli KTE101]|nr:major tail protein V [Escherichia coli KTE101]